MKSPDPPSRRSRGGGSISYDPKRKRWRARTPRDEHGTRQSSYHETREAAEAHLTAWVARVASATAPFDPSRPFGEYLRHWYRMNRGRWKPLQQRKIRSQINACRPLAHHPTDRLRTDHVDAFVADLGDRNLSPGYVHALGRLVVRALAWGVRRGILAGNPADAVELPASGRKAPQAYTAAEVRAITAGCRGERFEAAYLLWLHAGLRIGETMALPWTAIDATDDVVSVEQAEYTAAGRTIGGAKYGSEGTIDVARPIIARLAELRQAAMSPYILGKPADAIRPHDRRRHGHDRWCDTTVRRDWYLLLDRLKIRRLVPHGGRHAFATGHMQAGTDLADIADLMRHKSPAITAQTYLSGNRKRRREAADRLGRLFAVPDPAPAEQTS